MSPTSYRCSTSRCVGCKCKVRMTYNPNKKQKPRDKFLSRGNGCIITPYDAFIKISSAFFYTAAAAGTHLFYNPISFYTDITGSAGTCVQFFFNRNLDI